MRCEFERSTSVVGIYNYSENAFTDRFGWLILKRRVWLEGSRFFLVIEWVELQGDSNLLVDMGGKDRDIKQY